MPPGLVAPPPNRQMFLALLTDFGLTDPYVGVMKSVILSIAPGATVVDLTHELPPQDIRAGAFALRAAWPYLPPQAVVCAVVDPGVGTSRRPVALELGDEAETRSLVCPDNGLAAALLDTAPVRAAVTLDNPAFHLPKVSTTFHGRDLFAPVAAHLAAGRALAEVGSPLATTTLAPLSWPQPRRSGHGWEVTVLYQDRFGNLITNLPAGSLEPSDSWRVVELAKAGLSGPARSAPVRATFAAVEPGEAVAYWGSSGYLELAVRNGSAAEDWNLGVGAELRVAKVGLSRSASDDRG